MHLSDDLNSLLSSLMTQINTNIMLYYYNNLTKSQQNNTLFLSEYLCNNKGNFIISKKICVCDLGMFGYHCQDKGILYWKGLFTFFQIIFGCAYGILTAIFWISLILKILKDCNDKELIRRILFSPKYLIYINLVIISTSKFLYLLIDPFCQKDYLSHTHDNITYNISIAGLIGIYIQIMVVWLGILTMLNTSLGKFNTKCFVCLYRSVKIISILLMLLLYPGEFAVTYLDSQRSISRKVMSIFTLCEGIVVVSMFILTLLLIKDLKNKFDIFYGEHKDNKEEILTKIKSLKCVHDKNELYIGKLKTKHQEMNNKKDIIDFLVNAEKYNMLDLVESAIVGNRQKKGGYFNYDSGSDALINNYKFIDSRSLSLESGDEINLLKYYKAEKKSEEIISNSNKIESSFLSEFDCVNDSSDSSISENNSNYKDYNKLDDISLNESNYPILQTIRKIKRDSKHKNDNAIQYSNELNTEDILNKINNSYRNIKFNSKINLQNNNVGSNNIEWFTKDEEKLDYKLYYERELLHLNQFINDFNNFSNTNNANSNLSNKNIPTQKSKIMQTLTKQTFPQNSLTKSDKKIIYNIFSITITFLLLIFVVLYVNIILRINVILESKMTEIILLYITFLAEVACVILVYNLLFRDRHTQEYNSLRMIKNLHKFINPTVDGEKQAFLVFDYFRENEVFYRFKDLIV